MVVKLNKASEPAVFDTGRNASAAPSVHAPAPVPTVADVDPAAAKIYGFARYGGPITAAHPTARPQGVAEAAEQIREVATLAARYAEAGKPRIARDLLRDATDSL